MEIKFCKGRNGKTCHQIAIGVGGKRPADHCRAHYLAEYAHEFVTARVLAGMITDVRTNESAGPGEIVTLDPVCTRLISLVYGGLIEIIEDPGQAEGAEQPANAKAAATKG